VSGLDGSLYVVDEGDPQLDIGVADAYGYVLQVRNSQIAMRNWGGLVPALGRQRQRALVSHLRCHSLHCA
jgi:hypothetical protein